ncbi:hypothetical protein [Corallococcus sp. EGB]|uniref:hypothetical protein n=1 Tax=Corallococcus sp. EGB TaxID=1521117 RepID=UPI001CBDAD6E|nr:hypothetical protein [Corallococcus sp. EGB]
MKKTPRREVAEVPLEDHVEDPPKKVSVTLLDSQWKDLAAVARALGRDRQDVIEEMLKEQTKQWLDAASPAQLERYRHAHEELRRAMAPQPTAKDKPARPQKK